MELNVVYSSDNNYAQHAGVSILSLFENNKHFNKIDVYIIQDKIDKENIDKLDTIAKRYNRTINYINFDKYKEMLKLDMEWNISISAYARLFISKMLPVNIDRALYFDCDSVIVDKIDSLINEDIDNYYIAAVQDTVSSYVKSDIGIKIDDKYINSGMLIINLKKWREDRIEEKFLNFIKTHNGQVTHHDQGVINGVLNGKIKILHPKFNLMTVIYTMKRKNIYAYYGMKEKFYSEEQIDEAISHPIFIHFTPGFTTRPWVNGCKHPKKDIYLAYLKDTPWNKYVCVKDNSKISIRFINWIYTNLPFNIANALSSTITKLLRKGKEYYL